MDDLNNRNLFLHDSEAGSSRLRYLQGWFLMRPLSLTCRCMPSFSLNQTWSSLCTYFPVQISSSYKDISHIELGSILRSNFNWIISLKALSSKTVEFWGTGVRTSSCEFCGGIWFSRYHKAFMVFYILVRETSSLHRKQYPTSQFLFSYVFGYRYICESKMYIIYAFHHLHSCKIVKCL